MASIDKFCDVPASFETPKDAQPLIGFMETLLIGETQFAEDLELQIPGMKRSDKQPVVGSIESVSWEGGSTNPVSFSFWMSVTNKTELATLLHGDMDQTNVEYQFKIFEYDKEAKMWYHSFHTDETAMKAIVKVSGGERMLFLSDEPHGTVEKPEIYQVTLEVVPEDEEQALHIALASDKKLARQWGITRG